MKKKNWYDGLPMEDHGEFGKIPVLDMIRSEEELARVREMRGTAPQPVLDAPPPQEHDPF